MGIYVTMPIDSADARALLRVPPDDYVAERTRLVKEAKANKDKPLADFYQSLKRPAMSLWAVLAAGDDAKAVNEVVSITSKLGETQSGGTAGAVSAAAKDRRTAIERLVDRAVKALKTDKSAETRRAEIREIVDQLSRHPELADSWIAGTLRDLPEEEFGFGAFNVVADAPPDKKPARRTERTTPTRDTSRAAKAEELKQARKDVSVALRDLTAAERDVRAAQAEVRTAETALRQAEAARDKAERRHAAALERVAAI